MLAPDKFNFIKHSSQFLILLGCLFAITANTATAHVLPGAFKALRQLQSVFKCQEIESAIERLDCFDNAAKKFDRSNELKTKKKAQTSSAPKAFSVCEKAIKERLINPETLELFDVEERTKEEIAKSIEIMERTLKAEKALLELRCVQQGHLDETQRALCMFSQMNDETSKRIKNIDTLKSVLQSKSDKPFWAYRLKAESKTGTKITEHGYCGTSRDGTTSAVFIPN